MAHDVFISYSSRRLETAEAVCAALEAAGITCWIAPRNIPPSSNYGGEITSAIESGKLVLLIFCEHANISHYVMRELEMAVHYKRPVLPVRFDPVEVGRELRFYLASCQWLDATKQPLDYHLPRIVEAVQHIIAPGELKPVPIPIQTPAPKKHGRAPVVISALAAAVAILIAIVLWPKSPEPSAASSSSSPGPESSAPVSSAQRTADQISSDLFTRPDPEKGPKKPYEQ